jgi:hypothetical protein
MQESVLLLAGSILRYAHSSWWSSAPTVNVFETALVIAGEVPCSLLRIPFKLRGLVRSKDGKMQLVYFPTADDQALLSPKSSNPIPPTEFVKVATETPSLSREHPVARIAESTTLYSRAGSPGVMPAPAGSTASQLSVYFREG